MLIVDSLARPGLAPASLRLAEGECVALAGPSGAGKSLLLRAIADLDPATGRVGLDGIDRDAMPAFEWRRRVCYVAAEPGWWAEDVAAHFPDWTAAVPLVTALLLPPAIGQAPVARLSTGERQRLALARALVRRPRVLLLDEPTAALDGTARQAAETLLASQGLAMLWVSHDATQLARIASRRLTMTAGVLTKED